MCICNSPFMIKEFMDFVLFSLTAMDCTAVIKLSLMPEKMIDNDKFLRYNRTCAKMKMLKWHGNTPA